MESRKDLESTVNGESVAVPRVDIWAKVFDMVDIDAIRQDMLPPSVPIAPQFGDAVIKDFAVERARRRPE